jgi:hypothetical protein
MFLMSSLNNANEYQCITMCDSSVVAYWTRMHGVMGLNPGQVKLFFCFVQLSYTKVLYFPKIYNHTSLYGPTVNGVSVYLTSKVRSATMLLIPIVGN